MTKSQSAMEYLMIVALTFAIIVPTTYLFFSYSKESSTRVVDYRINAIGKSLVKASEEIYYSGEHAWTTIDVDMPPDINNVFIIANRELVFNATFQNSENEVVFFSGVNITGGSCQGNICLFNETFYSEGIKHIRVESISSGNHINLSLIGD